MARGFNKVILLGNLTRDPELKALPSGQNVCSFSLAINRTWRNADGEQQEAVDYIDCNAWGKAAEIINQYMQKGRALLVSGRLQQRTWEQDGQKRSKVDVVVEDFNFVGGPGESAAPATGKAASSSANSAKPSAKNANDDVVIEDIDDEPVDLSDIPF
ncbi:MAG TPA: single-stranded DNA-binding protein [Candidatus Saccharimonadales bacterium]